MSDFGREPVVVNYHQVAGAFPAAEVAHEGLRAEVGDPILETRLRAALAHVQLELRDAQTDPDVFTAPADAVTARFQTLAAQYARETGQTAPAAPGGLEVKFDTEDWLGFLKGFSIPWLLGRIRRHSFVPPGDPEPTSEKLRIALLSDWATGLYGARPIAATIADTKGGFDYVIHLGDVYYTGTPDEVEDRFLDCWPTIDGGKSRALNGNHEMYSGGKGYFDRILPAFGQGSSAFAIQNTRWLIVGLDTGYHEFDLAKGQAEWLRDVVSRAGDLRRVVLLTHHQLFSNTAKTQGVHMQAKLADLLEDKRIFAWYWGHEHIASIYEAHPIWGLHGRCIGHGGMPEFRKKRPGKPEISIDGHDFYRLPAVFPNPSCLVLDGPNPYIRGYESRYSPNGYLTLEIDSTSFVEKLCAPDGTVLFSQELA